MFRLLACKLQIILHRKQFDELTMNTFIKAGKTMLQAMAFANAGNYSEFRSLLRQVDASPDSGSGQIQCRPASSGIDHPALLPHIHRVL